ncbi:pentatricopeptide repeat-containing protein At2g20540-like [Gastrolobium bilobum]|uniref:pentatricopeptide repeat-containing protein At2g20540-like n=1 Tax=Gastrolobium bilobum TaxID=150636 RepID=UPI002AAF1C35|nr:pentatricopeptide repeat-containing protein At2g20540-like [Gastrolobium bilobum]
MGTATVASTLVYIAERCSSMRDLKLIHAHAFRTCLHQHTVVLGKLFRFAAVSPFGDLPYAHRMFDQMPHPTTFFYNILIRAHSQSTTSASHSTHLFNRMRQNGVAPDEYSFTFLLKSRSRSTTTQLVDEIHGAVFKFGFCYHLHVQNALIHLYAAWGVTLLARRVFEDVVKMGLEIDVVSWSGLLVAHVRAGELDIARRVFDEMPQRDVVSWTAMLSGYTRAKQPREALELFGEMMHAGVRPDEVTMLIVISACANLGDVETGRMVHRYVEKNGFGWMVALCNALIDMYGKCGCLEEAWHVFNGMRRKCLITWNTMMTACANHGNADDALYLFEWMIRCGVVPDGVTLLALLVAYAHKGLVDEGIRLFESMQRDYGVEPRIEHYGAVVDMLGRSGRLQEAYDLLTSIPIPSNDVIWGALLGACRIHGDVDMGERVIKKLLELKPDEGGYYILLRDIYVAAGRTVEANEMRQAMLASGARKTPGCSWVEA